MSPALSKRVSPIGIKTILLRFLFLVNVSGMAECGAARTSQAPNLLLFYSIHRPLEITMVLRFSLKRNPKKLEHKWASSHAAPVKIPRVQAG